MTDTVHNQLPRPGEMHDHLDEARHRAREMLAAEPNLGAIDDWRRALVSARDAAILIWLAWVALHALGEPPLTGAVLTALAAGWALLTGISTARSTLTQVRYYAAELDRERDEIRDHFDHEREEIVVLYAAKGFSGALLEQVVDTLCADEDRLLKIMMEEELGLHMYHMNHPLVVGAWNFAAALAGGLALALPMMFLSSPSMHLWMPLGGVVLMAGLAVLSRLSGGRHTLEFFTVSVVTGAVTGGAVYFLAQWLNLLSAGKTGG